MPWGNNPRGSVEPSPRHLGERGSLYTMFPENVTRDQHEQPYEQWYTASEAIFN